MKAPSSVHLTKVHRWWGLFFSARVHVHFTSRSVRYRECAHSPYAGRSSRGLSMALGRAGPDAATPARDPRSWMRLAQPGVRASGVSYARSGHRVIYRLEEDLEALTEP